MFRKYLLPLFAMAGVLFAIFTVITSSRPVPAAQPVAQPPESPFKSQVAGAGLIESSTEDIAVGTNVSGVVTEVLVKVGDKVSAGAPLFKIDDRDLQAELLVRKAALLSAQANIRAAESALAEMRSQWENVSTVQDDRVVSKEERDRRKFQVEVGDARAAQARADLATAQAQVEATQIELDRRIVRSPIDGQVIQARIRKGEFAQAGVTQQPLMLVGNTDTLHVRVDVDENDAWRVSKDRPARASLRGKSELATDLKFVRIEPYVVPKRSLTGESTERVDTRVLQILYSFKPTDAMPAYVGQQVDVTIESGSGPTPGSHVNEK